LPMKSLFEHPFSWPDYIGPLDILPQLRRQNSLGGA
jgi:hypothetical protein